MIDAAGRSAIYGQLTPQERTRLAGGNGADEIAARLHTANPSVTLAGLVGVLSDREALLAHAAELSERGAVSAQGIAQQGFSKLDQKSIAGSVFEARLGAGKHQRTIDTIARVLDAARAEPRDRTQPSGDLFKATVESVEKLLQSPATLARIEQDPFLKALHTQTMCTLKHVRIDFEIAMPTYVHDLVLKGPFPFDASIGALEAASAMLGALDATTSKSIAIPETPGQIQTEIQELEAKHATYVKRIVQNPLAAYRDFSNRLRAEGPQAKFPEFADVIRYLELFLKKEGITAQAEKSPALAQLRQTTLDDLHKLKSEGFPYGKTVDGVEKALAFFDVYERGKPDSNAAPDLYHAHRYQYYSHFLKAQTPDHVMFPTFYALGATDLLKTRGVPIGFLGVPPETSWVDGFSQSPLEFWHHDVNHTRRMWQFFSEHAHKLGVTPFELAERSDKLVQTTLIPIIKINKTDSEDVKNEKRMMKLILFEMFHEDALAADLSVIKGSLMRAPNTPTPFEELVPHDGHTEGKVDYVMEPGGTTLAYVYRKVASNFYDFPGMRMEAICGAQYRTQEFVAHCAKLLAQKLAIAIPDEVMDAHVRNDGGFNYLFRHQLELQLEEDPALMAPLSTAAAATSEGTSAP
jgi:hypothetical protein